MRATPMPALPAPTSTMRCSASSLLLLPCTRSAPYTPATAVAAVPCTPTTIAKPAEAGLHGHPPITGIAGLCSPRWDCLVVLQKMVQHATSAC